MSDQLKTRKFRITAPRYINGKYIRASPDAPVDIELPATTKPRHDLQPAEEPQEQLKAAHNVVKAHEVPPSHEAVKVQPAKDSKGKRSNDNDPLS